jgi:uncharacterized FAD-dependent dehydrogenase
MSILLKNITLGLDEEEALLEEKAAAALRIAPAEISGLKIIRKSLDARKKKRIHFLYALAVSLPPDLEKQVLGSALPEISPLEEPPPLPEIRIAKGPKERPVVVGTGPAGLFAALRLVESGVPPLIVERGKELPERVKDVDRFWKERDLAPESNVQFGEGGAGTFSDGKLYTRLQEPRIAFILKTFCRFGAPEEILSLQRPHLGTDRLRSIILALRKYLQEKGAEYRFRTRLTGLEIHQGALRGAILNDQIQVPASILVLAIGNGARDTFQMLSRSGGALESKPFALGLRVEHPQKLIDRIQYGPSAGHPRLPPADYHLTFRSSQDRGVYSFCMCPGGLVIGAGSEPGQVVTNGMSLFRRNAPWANSALIVSVGPTDFPSPGPLAGVEFQRRWEEKAFLLGRQNFKAPAQNLLDFLNDRDPGPIRETSFRPGVSRARLEECLPSFVVEGLREALPVFNRKMPGFCSPEAVLIGVETRTSSPVRILREEDFQSRTVRGLYPCGEGSGYAGGIVSSALDGMKAAEAIIKTWA